MTIFHIWYIATAKNKNEQQQYSSEMTQMFAKIIQICVFAHIRRKMHAKIWKKINFLVNLGHFLLLQTAIRAVISLIRIHE